MKKFYQVLLFFFITSAFFYQFFFKGLLPIPADTITGLYHPYRDFYAQDYPNGMPYDNSLITDPIRQQYPWKHLSLLLLQSGVIPTWNPYSFAGTPLLGNFQSAAFYPLNILFVFMPFDFAWSLLIFFQPLLAGLFMFFYLRFFRLHISACILGGVVFAFSGFSVAWMEWGTILQTGLWLPLILLAKEQLLKKRTWQWMGVLIFAEVSMFFAGHLQTFFYAFILSNIYLFIRIFQIVSNQKNATVNNYLLHIKTFSLTASIILFLSAIQWIPTLRFIFLSARELDQANWQKEGWFLPWQHLVQFIAPDFFGNPATLNYWGVWNYGEFVGYIGIIPLVFALYALFFRRDKKTIFALGLLVLSLLLVLPTVIAKLPFILNIPFISSSQPTRLLFVIDFVLAFLAALGLDYYMKNGKKIFVPIGVVGLTIGGLWLFVLVPSLFLINIPPENLAVAKRNLYLPSCIFLTTILLIDPKFIKIRKKALMSIVILLITISIFDLFRFFNKFNAFSETKHLYPQTKVTQFLQSQPKPFRIMSLDSRILPPNFGLMYGIEAIEGYDPLYLRRYGEFISALEKDKPDISGPLGFNRIITPRNYNSQLIDLLNVKYILSLEDLKSPKLKKIFEEGQTKIYENIQVLPRAFFVKRTTRHKSDKETIQQLFITDVKREAVIQPYENAAPSGGFQLGKVTSVMSSENNIVINTETTNTGFLVVSSSWYPTVRLFIDDEPMNTNLYIANYNFIGILVPKGIHTLKLEYKL